MPQASAATPQLGSDDVAAIDSLRGVYDSLKAELSRVIVGQEDVVELLVICLFARGHSLLLGVPGLAKTLLVSRLAETMSLKFSRIQFTPDLMPMDITGTDILQDTQGGKREFEFIPGPVFANIVLATSPDAGGADRPQRSRRPAFRPVPTLRGHPRPDAGAGRRARAFARAAEPGERRRGVHDHPQVHAGKGRGDARAERAAEHRRHRRRGAPQPVWVRRQGE